MERLKIYPLTMSREDILQERNEAYNRLSPAKKLESLLKLNALARKMNRGLPLKMPQGKGIIIYKQK